MRIYELAKEIGKEPAEVRVAAQELGAPIKTNFNILEEPFLQKVRDHFLNPVKVEATAEAAPKPAAEKADVKADPKVETKADPAKPAASPFGLVFRPPKQETPLRATASTAAS